jgi:hypothetical protein
VSRAVDTPESLHDDEIVTVKAYDPVGDTVTIFETGDTYDADKFCHLPPNAGTIAPFVPGDTIELDSVPDDATLEDGHDVHTHTPYIVAHTAFDVTDKDYTVELTIPRSDEGGVGFAAWRAKLTQRGVIADRIANAKSGQTSPPPPMEF